MHRSLLRHAFLFVLSGAIGAQDLSVPQKLGTRSLAPGLRDAAPGTVASFLEITSIPGVDSLGLAVAAIGDVDGDGVVDLAVGDPWADGAELNEGAVHIVFLNPDLSIKGTQKIAEQTGGFGGQLALNDNLGWAVSALGDLDGDGIQELLAGAPQANGGAGYSSAWLLFLNPDGTVRDEVQYSQGLGGFQETIRVGDPFGSAFAPLGDIDGNGALDFAITRAWGPSSQNSYFFTLRLRADGTVKNTIKVGPGLGGMTGTTWSDWGDAACGLPDLDGDGINELVVADHACCGNTGTITVLFPNANGTVHSQQSIEPAKGPFPGTAGFTALLEGGDLFGGSVVSVGDLDGDGVADLAVGASGDDEPPAFGVGAVYILFLNPDATVHDYRKISQKEGGWTSPLQHNDSFGRSLASLGDVDGNGTTEVFVGTRTSFYVLSLNTR